MTSLYKVPNIIETKIAINSFHSDERKKSSSETTIGTIHHLSVYTFANQNWSDVALVKLANAGTRGAWFYLNPERGSVVVKSQSEAEKQLMGTVFLRGMNINSPDAKIVSRYSMEGQQLSKLGEPHGLNSNNPTQYLVMDRVMGPSYNDLSNSTEHLQLIINNLENLGELAVYDLILGNFDRFQLDSSGFNAGNIMFQEGVLRPIDTDCTLDEERFGFQKLALKKILEGKGDYDAKISNKLAINLAKGVDSNLLPKEKIKAGMDKALKKTILFGQNFDLQKSYFINNCKERGYTPPSFPKSVEVLLQLIVNTSKSNNNFG